MLPLTVKVKPDPPAEVDVGLMEVVVGTGLVGVVTVNVWLFDVPPPGAGFITTTGYVPTVATSEALIVAMA